MPVGVRIDARKRTRGDGTLDAWSAALSQPAPAMEAVSSVIAVDMTERFATRTDPWGQAWAALSPVTIAIRTRRGALGGAEGLLRSRYATVVDGGRKVLIGIASQVARWQHFGDPNHRVFGRARKPLPARPALPIRPSGAVDVPRELLLEIKQAFLAGIREAVRRARR